MRRSWVPVIVGQMPGSLSEAAQLGREYIEWTDKIVDAFKEPYTQAALALQKTIFAIADEFGVGEEVRAMVYAIRGAQYVGAAAANLGITLSGAGAAAAGLVASIGAFGAAGVAGAFAVVVAFIASIFGGDDSDEEAAKRRKKRRARAKKTLRELLEPVTLSSMADEQDTLAAELSSDEMWGAGTPAFAEAQARKAKAAKLAAFYRAAKKRLTKPQRHMFESLLNVGRWGHAVTMYQSMSPAEQARMSTLAYEGGWTATVTPGQLSAEPIPTSPIEDYGVKLQRKLDSALATLRRQSGAGTARPVTLVGTAGTVAVAGSAAVLLGLAFVPGPTSAALQGAKGLVSRLTSGARRIVR